MMLRINRESDEEVLLRCAESLCVAARTAPKGKGRDLLTTLILTGSDKDALALKMKEIAQRDALSFFERDAGNIQDCMVIVLIGSIKEPLGIPHCGFCGFEDCAAMSAAGGTCSFNSTDLGIALGSAASRAADLRLDNRIMYSAGKAAIELNLFPEEVSMAYAIPLSVTGKSPFFDRAH